MCSVKSARTYVHVPVYSDSVKADPWLGSPVIGAHLQFCEFYSQCAKQPPEDRNTHCDLAPEVTELHIRGTGMKLTMSHVAETQPGRERQTQREIEV